MLFQNGYTLQYKDSKIVFEKVDIRIRNKIIYEISSYIQPEPNEECIDLNNDLVLPGMVNSHYHSYTNILRGTSFGEPLEIWSHDTVALGRILTQEDMEISTALGICEMIRAGVTACVDHLPHLGTAFAAGKVYERSGFKVGLAPMIHNIKDEDLLYGFNKSNTDENSVSPFLSVDGYLDYYKSFIDEFYNPSENIQVMVGINSPQRTDLNLLKASSDLAVKYKLPVHCHLLETKWQRITADHDQSPLLLMDQFGLLGKQTSLAHCVWLMEEELDLIAQKNAIAISNPTSNSFIGSGIFPSMKFRSRNIPIALGSDGVNCGTNHNMIEILRIFILLQRTQEIDYENWIKLDDAYKMISSNGSRVLNFPIKSGQIKPNYAADMVIVDKEDFLDILEETIPNQIIFHPSPLPVKDVLINGKFIMREKKILGIDEEALYKHLNERKPYLRESMKKALTSASIEKKSTEIVYQRLFNKQ